MWLNFQHGHKLNFFLGRSTKSIERSEINLTFNLEKSLNLT